jgi:acetate kinase
MAASMEGLDALVFTGGVGERSFEIRSLAAAGLGFLGIRLGEPRNRQAQGDADISAEGASVRSAVVPAREEIQMAHEIRDLLSSR